MNIKELNNLKNKIFENVTIKKINAKENLFNKLDIINEDIIYEEPKFAGTPDKHDVLASRGFDPYGHLDLGDEDVNQEEIDEPDECYLSFSNDNAKIDSPSLSLPGGYTCVHAGGCKTFVKRDASKYSSGLSVKDVGGDMRCFGNDVAYKKNLRDKNWRNFDLLKQFKNDKEGMVNLINKSLDFHRQINGNFNSFRIHTVGDFYTQEYFDAWVEVAKRNQDKLFYTHTTSIPFWVARLGGIPNNMVLTASRDDLKKPEHSELIDKHGLKQRIMVDTEEEAQKLGLPIDVDDSLAMTPEPNKFALLLHGTQPKATGKTSQARKNSGILKDIKNKIKKQ